ncbi:MAG: hypothetical protein M3Z04_23165 [Chloroflexota bacterium]|nr:hypothetical protein [Chloroflexota bacterium]
MDEELGAVETNTALVPTRQEVVPFYSDALPVALAPDGNLYVALRPITDALGLAPNGQRARIQREPFLAEGTQTLRMTGADGRQRAMFALRVDLLNVWLLNVDTGRVRPELQATITRYKRECAQALWRYFQGEPRTALAVPSPAVQDLVQLRDLHLALARVLEEQITVAQRTADAHTRLDRAGQVVRNLNQRLEAVEQRLDPAQVLTDEQAAAVQSAVTGVATLLGLADGKSHYAAVWTEVHRRFQAPDYKHIKQQRFADVLAFLEGWATTTAQAQAALAQAQPLSNSEQKE